MKNSVFVLFALLSVFMLIGISEARWYDPESGRFLSEDPIGFEGGDVNLYVYCQNNPTNCTDPLGLFMVQLPYTRSDMDQGLFSYFPNRIRNIMWGIYTDPTAVGMGVGSCSVSGFTKHGINRVIERGIRPQNILDALRNPLRVNDIVYDRLGRPSQRIIGREVEIIINPSTGEVITVFPH